MSEPTRSPGAWRVRAAGLDDLERLAAIAEADEHGSWDRAAFASELSLAWSRVMVLEEGAGVVGFLVYWVVADEVQLLNVAVDPGHRRRGAARRLMAHLHEQARALETVRVALEVRADNAAARSLYRSLGYTEVGLRRGYYAKDGTDAVLMECDMRGDA